MGKKRSKKPVDRIAGAQSKLAMAQQLLDAVERQKRPVMPAPVRKYIVQLLDEASKLLPQEFFAQAPQVKRVPKKTAGPGKI